MTSQETRRSVGRPPQPGRRAEILTAATRIVAERGVETLSLAELAKALGCSTYTLTYHFGSKDRLLAAIVGEVERHLQAEIAELAADPATPLPDLLRHYWQAVRSPSTRPYLQLWLELLVLSARHPDRYPGFQDQAVTGWRTLAADILRARTGSDALANLIVATVTGLELDLLLNPDPTPADAALHHLLTLLETHPNPFDPTSP
ncbi:TetR/AcrR family transcriptional regulator [Actinocorallia sp. API 0066]|uniref:TetR/AcrR family transcriptional regulator n=1 Tax=Actinocorallia sp. API 0066 TaxID=2896846 RepID=UPI001E561BF7|nr:TetR/AcrR family transcriptional regulator [Actinocorallia sp. API 0066]MCD0449261.1 TetR/AcrR family transcriptional regulator [Actinocorallia sp. API 0066]